MTDQASRMILACEALESTKEAPVSGWHQMIEESTIADAILDRIIHNAHRIELKGDSMRRKTNRADLTQNENTETMDNNT